MRGLLAFLAVAVIRLLSWTWRVTATGPLPDSLSGPLVFCFWHGRQAGLLAHARPRSVAVLVSFSKDGDLQARILGRLGFSVARGSSSRGGSEGLRGIVKLVRKGCDAAFAVDGPRGPLRRAKAGAVFVAQQTGGLLVPITARASRAWTFDRAWDLYQLPKPFARIDLIRGPAICAGTRKTSEVLVDLEKALKQLD